MLTGKVPLDFSQLYPRLYFLIGGVCHNRLLDWWIYRHYGTFTQVARMYYPENPRTPVQQGHRSILYDANYNWHQFDDFTKNFYNQLKRPEHMSGYNRYLSLYLKANYPMIIYWGSLKRSAGQDITISDYFAEPYFSGIQRIRSFSSYPANPPYGTIIYRSDLKRFFRFQEDVGWAGFDAAGGQAFPVGSVFISVVSTNPATLLGYGTWVAFGTGRMLVGLDSSDTDFNTAEKTGGAKTVTLTVDQIPSHKHDAYITRSSTSGSDTTQVALSTDTSSTKMNTPTEYTGGGQAHNNLPPYIVVYMWKRTA
jgi:hypothetical protein